MLAAVFEHVKGEVTVHLHAVCNSYLRFWQLLDFRMWRLAKPRHFSGLIECDALIF